MKNSYNYSFYYCFSVKKMVTVKNVYFKAFVLKYLKNLTGQDIPEDYIGFYSESTLETLYFKPDVKWLWIHVTVVLKETFLSS